MPAAPAIPRTDAASVQQRREPRVGRSGERHTAFVLVGMIMTDKSSLPPKPRGLFWARRPEPAVCFKKGPRPGPWYVLRLDAASRDGVASADPLRPTLTALASRLQHYRTGLKLRLHPPRSEVQPRDNPRYPTKQQGPHCHISLKVSCPSTSGISRNGSGLAIRRRASSTRLRISSA